jgi:hypothetical protein
MCIFSGTARVSKTRIFARRLNTDRQILIYQMEYTARRDLAMILPIPVSSHDEQAVRFIDMEAYPAFFDDLARAFPKDSNSKLFSRNMSDYDVLSLVVHDVGCYEASFVPTQADFDRLDPRFRLPDHIWAHLRRYSDYGFAVFKLKPGSITPHPMAFDFPTRLAEKIFFPTVHVHDGRIHTFERFDHSLYWQGRPQNIATDKPSLGPVGNFLDAARVGSLIDGPAPAIRRAMRGRYANLDVVV